MDEHRQVRTKAVSKAYREYLEWVKSLLALAATSSINQSPEQEPELRNVVRLQILFIDREALRFDYLLRNCTSEITNCRSLSDINERLLEGWRSLDENGIITSNSNYITVLQGIAELEGNTDSPALDKPFQALTRNLEYRKARTEFAKRIEELNKTLG
jgi:hypothetical protein